MNFFSVTFILLAFSFSFSPAFAGGSCEGKASAHEKFCSDKDKHLCGVHSGVCQWKETQTLQVLVKSQDKSCVAKAGQEAHESFCSGNSRHECAVHSGLCSWE